MYANIQAQVFMISIFSSNVFWSIEVHGLVLGTQLPPLRRPRPPLSIQLFRSIRCDSIRLAKHTYRVSRPMASFWRIRNDGISDNACHHEDFFWCGEKRKTKD